MKIAPADKEAFRTAVEQFHERERPGGPGRIAARAIGGPAGVSVKFGPHPPEALAAAESLLRARTLARGEHLLVGGMERASDVVFVVQGVLREYFLLADGTERTKAFIAEAQVAGSLADLLSDAPSRASIVAEHETRVLLARYDEMKALGQRFPSWADFGRRTTAALLSRKAEREYELLALDAEGRYEAFLAQCPGMEARVTAKNVASYLGITPVHLSRLRRRRSGARAGR
ncbi:MAG: Crp/Fnr family transcriptional regulator [Deltaproteobacteria bacterium]|nr:Crp/Fnr family transcriptional regulator [Deltaproteobacteria bacterium]